MKRFFGFYQVMISLLALLPSCVEKSKGEFLITVNYSNVTPGKHFVLEQMPYGAEKRPVFLDSAVAKTASGKIVLKGLSKEQGLYQLLEENGRSFLLINDVEDMSINFDASKKEDFYTVSGSDASKELLDYVKQYIGKSSLVNQAFVQLDSIKKVGGSDSLQIVATNAKNEAMERLTKYAENAIDKSSNPALTLFMLGTASSLVAPDRFSKTLDAVIKKFPDYKPLAQVKENYDTQLAQQTQMEEQRQQYSLIGKDVPDFALPNEEGKPISIASFRGKYLLVDFWASWCGPCRMENPNVVSAYNKYKDKNFTILGVSLDKQKDRWLQAIKDDQLTWAQISDLQYWNSKAVSVFKFNSIPFSILVDPKGKVIAENLRGEELDQKLKELLP